jgi:hypothetical protein
METTDLKRQQAPQPPLGLAANRIRSSSSMAALSGKEKGQNI